MKEQTMDEMCEHLSRACPSSTSDDDSDDDQSRVVQVLAAQTLKIASINGLGEDNKLETELEDEIRWEEQHPPREIIGRARRKCEEILHSKKMMLVIIILNIVDCLLVVGELTLDFHQVTNQLVSMEDHTKDFMGKLRVHNSASLADLHNVNEDNLTVLFNRFLGSYIIWNPADYSGHTLAAECIPIQAAYNATAGVAPGALSSLLSFVAALGQRPLKMKPMEHDHRKYEQMAHKLHYCSISILSFLLLETLLKIASVGKRFLKKKMELFDAVVVAISFVLDVVFVQGLTASNMRTFVVILSFLLPWRVLRVVNSLIVTLMHQNRFHLKVLYKQKRKITKQFQEATENIQLLEKQVKVLKSMCVERGIQDWEINKAMAKTIKPTAEGGLKTLGTLIFKAAESFASLTVPKLNDCTTTTSTSSTTNTPTRPGGSGTLDSGRPPSLPFTISCNGDVHRPHQHSAPNGLSHLVDQDLQGADDASPSSQRSARLTPTTHKPRGNGKASIGGKAVPTRTATNSGPGADTAGPRHGSSPDLVHTAGYSPRVVHDLARVVHTAVDSPSVVRFSDESLERVSSNGSVVPEPSDSTDFLEEGLGLELAVTTPRLDDAEGGKLKEDDSHQGDLHGPDQSKRQSSVDSLESSRPTRFYLSSDESIEADMGTQDGHFTRL
ncbi:hypothetical protein ACOMHN_005945 [Nucella lapillus]